jgi:hypothetical protein
MLARIVTGDESHAKKKFKVTPSSRQVMLTVFWDHDGILLTTFQPQGQPVNADILRKLHKAIQWKRPGLLTKGVLLLHDNARPHTANKKFQMGSTRASSV